jgi:hypothetical protein
LRKAKFSKEKRKKWKLKINEEKKVEIKNQRREKSGN